LSVADQQSDFGQRFVLVGRGNGTHDNVMTMFPRQFNRIKR
jgi:hypothetical protein